MRAAILTPPWKLPASAGRWGLHIIARELRLLGVDAFVVGREYEYDLIPDAAPVIRAEDYLGGDDVAVIVPESYQDVKNDGWYTNQIAKEHAACIVYVQGYSFAYPREAWETHYWSFGERHRQLVRERMGIPDEMPIEHLYLPVDTSEWKPRQKVEGSVLYYPRRNGRVLDHVARECDTTTFRVTGMRHWQLRPLVGQADIFLLASDAEGFSMASVEAMAAECAVVTWPSGGMVDHCNGDTAIVVEQGDVKGLIEAVVGLKGDPARARRLGKNARRLVSERFSWPAFRSNLKTAWEAVSGHG